MSLTTNTGEITALEVLKFFIKSNLRINLVALSDDFARFFDLEELGGIQKYANDYILTVEQQNQIVDAIAAEIENLQNVGT